MRCCTEKLRFFKDPCRPLYLEQQKLAIHYHFSVAMDTLYQVSG